MEFDAALLIELGHHGVQAIGEAGLCPQQVELCEHLQVDLDRVALRAHVGSRVAEDALNLGLLRALELPHLVIEL